MFWFKCLILQPRISMFGSGGLGHGSNVPGQCWFRTSVWPCRRTQELGHKWWAWRAHVHTNQMEWILGSTVPGSGPLVWKQTKMALNSFWNSIFQFQTTLFVPKGNSVYQSTYRIYTYTTGKLTDHAGNNKQNSVLTEMLIGMIIKTHRRILQREYTVWNNKCINN